MTTPAFITRQAAEDAGLTRFYLGVPCKRGHVAYRYLSNGRCSACHRPAVDPDAMVKRQQELQAQMLTLEGCA
jgi:hypothetical protein